MTERIEEWSLTRETIAGDRLSVVLYGRETDGADAAVSAVDALFKSHGIEAELVCVPAAGGPGTALKTAFARSTGAYVLTLEGDVLSRAERTPDFFAALVRNQADVVVGSKRHPKSVVNYPWHRRLASAVYFSAVRLILGVALSDTESGVMLWRRKTLGEAIGRMLVKSNAFALELLTIARTCGARVATAPVVVTGMTFGVLNLKTIRRVLHDTLAIVYRQRLLGYYEKSMAPAPFRDDPLVSVVIPCPQSTWMLEECLAAMTRQTYGKWECIVLPDEVEAAAEGSRRTGAGDREGVRRETRDEGDREGVRRETRDEGDREGVRRETRDEGDRKGVRRETRDASGDDRHETTDGVSRLTSDSSCLSSPVSRPDTRFRFIPTGKVRPAEKRNLGIRAAKGSIVAFIDDDAYPDPHWLEYAVRYFSVPEIGAVGGPGVTPPGDTRLARLGGRVYDNVLVSGNYRYRYKAGGVRRDVEDYPSCNLFVRRDLLDRIGGYRTDFWPGEDTLLCKDIVDLWKRIVYDPWVVVYHHRRPLFRPHLRQLGRYGFHRGYFCKRFPSNSLRLSYFIPTAFDLYLLTWIVLVACPMPVVMPAWAFVLLHLYIAGPMLLYAALVLATTATWNPVNWLLTAAGVVLSHMWYGLQFLLGICARRAPCEYIGGDHASATVDAAKKGQTEE